MSREDIFDKLLKTETYSLPTMEEWKPIAMQVCSKFDSDLAVELENEFLNITAARNSSLFPLVREVAEPNDNRSDATLLTEWLVESDEYMKVLKKYVYDCIEEERE